MIFVTVEAVFFDSWAGQTEVEIYDVDSDSSRREFFGLEFGVSHWRLRASNLVLHLENNVFSEKDKVVVNQERNILKVIYGFESGDHKLPSNLVYTLPSILFRINSSRNFRLLSGIHRRQLFSLRLQSVNP